jgi:hypothetical protein
MSELELADRPTAGVSAFAPERSTAPTWATAATAQGAEKVLALHDWMGDSANYEPRLTVWGCSA